MTGGHTWSRKKKDQAPRGIFRHPSGVWAVRYTCGRGHLHQERVGPVKGEAIPLYHARRARALDELGWCPAQERAAARARADQAITFRAYAADYTAWAQGAHRSFRNTASEVRRLTAHFGDSPLVSISHGDVERYLAGLRTGERAVTGATMNRYRDRLSGMFTRAARLGLVERNPVHGIRKAKEAGGRVVYLTAGDETAIRDQLAPALRPLFAFSLHTGLRWSEQAALRWADVDLLAGLLTVRATKNGQTRRVPINSVVAALLVDRGAVRTPRSDAEEPVFGGAAYRTVSRAFVAAVGRAQAALRDAATDASRLEGYTWHGNRHTFASRLVMAGVDLLAVQTLGGWRTPAMVQRYAHLAPEHMARAIERLVISSPGDGVVELRRNFDEARAVDQPASPPVAQSGTVMEQSSRRGGRARLKASDSKSDRGASPSGVQILSPPPNSHLR
jgi:integrase